MNVFWISKGALERRAPEQLAELAQRDDGFLWIDIPACDDEAAQLLKQHLGLHPHGIEEARRRAPIPKIHVYHDHFFCVLHTPELAPGGKLHIFQTALFIHENKFLVSLHLPADAGCAPELVWRETDITRERIEAGRSHPKAPGQLGHVIVSAIAKRLDACVEQLAAAVGRIESTVASGRLSEYERMLEGLFQVRHNLQAARTIAGTSREVHARMLAYSRGLNAESAMWLQDLVDHFDRLKNVCDEEKELLQEVLDLYQTRVANDLSQLVRKLTALGAILVADTLVAGIYGMNFKHMPELDWTWGYPMALGMMLVISLAMAWWFRKKDWL